MAMQQLLANRWIHPSRCSMLKRMALIPLHHWEDLSLMAEGGTRGPHFIYSRTDRLQGQSSGICAKQMSWRSPLRTRSHPTTESPKLARANRQKAFYFAVKIFCCLWYRNYSTWLLFCSAGRQDEARSCSPALSLTAGIPHLFTTLVLLSRKNSCWS